MQENTRWLSCYKANPQAKLRLFCFPFAGGGSSIFRTWGQDLPSWVEVCPVQFPGRENRLQEKPFKHMSDLVEATVKALSHYFDLPFVFFGHSMGAWIAYEIACYLRKNANLLPKHLFISGRFAPHISSQINLHSLPEKEFKDALGRYNGTPKVVLENDEIMQLIMPLLRADFSICETYSYIPREALSCPITAFNGADDHLVDAKGLCGWEKYTSNKFRKEIFPGDHFFLRTAQKDLLRSISEELNFYV